MKQEALPIVCSLEYSDIFVLGYIDRDLSSLDNEQVVDLVVFVHAQINTVFQSPGVLVSGVYFHVGIYD
jgi:hypothetical protein